MEQGKHLSAAGSPLIDFNAVCQRIRSAVEPARVHAVSLHDDKGDVLWLTENSMGPDEHNAVRQAFEAFSAVNGPQILAYDLGDSRSAVLFRAVNARRALVGAVMLIVDTRSVSQDNQGATRLMTPKLQRELSDFAAIRPDPQRAAAASHAPAAPALSPAPMAPPFELSIADSVRVRKPALHAISTVPAAPVTPPMPAAPSGTAASAGNTVKRAPVSVTPEIDRLHAALRRSPIALHVQRLVPLTKGSQLKRYEVLLRSKSDDAPNAAPQAMLKAAVENGLGSVIDRRVVTELIGWLVHHPDVWRTKAVLFSVNLTVSALHDDHFIKFVELCLAKSSLPKAMIAFEVDVSAALNLGDRVNEVAAALHRLGCPMVLDDFGMRTECFDLLRLPAVRYVKLASEITTKMRSDKLSQAAITAVVQMARVLGMHTVAKRTETAAEQEWLTALGVDFIQSNALSPSVSIESLSKAQNPKD